MAETSRAHAGLGYRKVTAIPRDGHGETINPKRVARPRRRDKVWSYDIIRDPLADGSAVRSLSVIDEYSRECVRLRSARSFPSRRVIDSLEELLVTTGRKPDWLRGDNGPEFVASQLQEWLKAPESAATVSHLAHRGRTAMWKASTRACGRSS